MFIRPIISLVVVLLSAKLALGQCQTVRYGVTTYNKAVVTQEVIAPIAVPILIPTTVFQYLPALQAPAPVIATNAVQQQVVAPQVVQQQQQFAPQVAQPATVQAPNNCAQDIDRIVRERVDAILREREYAVDKGPPTLILPNSLRQTPENNSVSPPGDINQQVANMLASKTCVQCHTEGDKPVKGNVTLFKRNGGQLLFQPTVTKARILSSVTPDASGNSAMPPYTVGPSLTNVELTLLRQWANQP